MPRKMQYPVARLIRFSRMEAEALRFIGGPRGMSEALRTAVWHFMKNSGRFDVDGFRKHVQKTVLPDLGADAKKAFQSELGALDDRMERETEESAFPLDERGIAAWLGDAKRG